jgi:hypothetical protein
VARAAPTILWREVHSFGVYQMPDVLDTVESDLAFVRIQRDIVSTEPLKEPTQPFKHLLFSRRKREYIIDV